MDLLGLLQRHTYFAVFTILFLCGIGLPAPEEVTIVGGGYLMRLREADWGPPLPLDHGFLGGLPRAGDFFLTTSICILGIVLGDSVLYFLGRFRGERFLSHRWVRRFLTERKMDKARRWFERYGAKTVFVARFFTGIRMVVYFVAGSLGMPAWRFYAMHLAGCLISVPISVYAGWYFGHNIDEGLRRIQEINHLAAAAIGGLALLALAFILVRRRLAARKTQRGGRVPESGRRAGP